MEPVLRLDTLKIIDTQKRILISISNAVIAFHLTDEWILFKLSYCLWEKLNSN